MFGLARNPRLEAMIATELDEAKARFAASGQPARVFKELEYATRDSSSKNRRVVAKAEHLERGPTRVDAFRGAAPARSMRWTQWSGDVRNAG